MDEQHRLSVGPTGRDGVYAGNRAARACDVLLALGTRFGDRSASAWIPGVTHSIPPTRLVHVDVEPTQIGRNYPAEIGIVGDVKLVLRQLIAACERRGAPQSNCKAWIASAARWKHEWESAIDETRGSDMMPMHGDRVIAELVRVTPRNAIVVSDIGAHHSWVVQQWKVPQSGLLLQSGGFATMGFGVAGSLGAQLAAPDRPVLAVVGDGGFLMHASAVATAVEYDLPVVWVVWNNCGYVSIRDIQFGFFGSGREIASRFRSARTGDLISTDFALMAQAMGANGLRVERPADLGEQVATALASRRPTVIDVRVEADLRRRTAGGWDMLPLKGTPPNYDPDPHRQPMPQFSPA